MATRDEQHERSAASLLRLLAESDLPFPDDMIRSPDGSLTLLWHEQRAAVVIEPDDAAASGLGPGPRDRS